MKFVLENAKQGYLNNDINKLINGLCQFKIDAKTE